MIRKGVTGTPAVMSAADDDEDEMSSPDEENIISASEEEEGSDDERKHTKLLEAISSLGGRKRMKQTERSEASLQVSEFSVSADGAGDKVNLSDLLSSMEKTPGAPKKTKKQLKNLENRKDTLELPLSKQQTEKIHREVSYVKTVKDVSRWEGTITQNQRAEQLVFPLRPEPTGHKRIEEVVSGWKAQTPLEQEIFSLLHRNQQPVLNPLLTPVEEASLKAMSLEEMKIRRAELQKARALQSYYEAKARRERKIKSKKYHKVQKKVKVRDYQRQFEEMMKADPEAALEELKKMEMSRMQERMSLKHQNSGKWAKSKAIMAKYDESARKAMQEQLEMNKSLTQKLLLPDDDEDDDKDKDDEDAEALPDFVNDAEPITDSVNPWMRGRLRRDQPETSSETRERDSTEQQKERDEDEEEEKEEEEEEEEEEKLLREFERKRKLRHDDDDDVVPVQEIVTVDTTEQVVRQDVSTEGVTEITDHDDDDDDDEEEEEENEEEEEVVSEFNSLFNRLINSRNVEAGPEQGAELLSEGVELLDEGAELLEDLEQNPEPSQTSSVSGTQTSSLEDSTQPPTKKKKKREIDLNQVLTKEAKIIKVPIKPAVIEEEEEEEVHAEQTAIIKEAFEGDDVISDFLKDKRKQEQAGLPKVVDLTLPGWGEWGGVGIKTSRRKRRKFRVKAPQAPPRKDQKLPAVIISEKRNISVANHQVNQLPFPFQTCSQFETSICSPVGQTWNTQTTVKKLTAPKVLTKLGTIITPMSREDLRPEERPSGGKRTAQISLEGEKMKRRRNQSNKRRQKAKKLRERETTE